MKKYFIILIAFTSFTSISAMHNMFPFFDPNSPNGDPHLQQKVKSFWYAGCFGYGSYLSGRMAFNCFQNKTSHFALRARRLRQTRILSAISGATACFASFNVKNFVTSRKIK